MQTVLKYHGLTRGNLLRSGVQRLRENFSLSILDYKESILCRKEWEYVETFISREALSKAIYKHAV